MRLFDNQSPATLQLSTEQFNEYYQNSVVISQESLTMFFNQIKDSVNTINAVIFDGTKQRAVIDALSKQYQTEHAVKHLDYVYTREEYVPIPENFKGKYVDYLDDLINTSSVMVQDTYKTLDNLKLAVSSFINEYSENKVHTLYGVSYFKASQKLIDKHTNDIKKYFPAKTNAVKAPIGSVLKSLKDVEELYGKIQTLNTFINDKTIQELQKQSNDVVALIDALIEQNIRSGILLKNNDSKKQLIDAINTAAREVEFVSYLFSNTVFFYSAFQKLSEKLIELSKVNA